MKQTSTGRPIILAWVITLVRLTPCCSQDQTLSAVEPPVACLLELQRLAGFGQALTYTPSRNRQSHLYTVSERRSPTSIALKRIFLR